MAEETAAAPTTAPTATRGGRIRHPVRVEKHHLLGLLVWLGILDLIVIGIASYLIDQLINGGSSGLNSASPTFLPITLIAALLLLAAIVSGVSHFHHYNSGSVGTAASTALIAWVIMLLAWGFACKSIDVGYTGSTTKALEAFVFIITFFLTIYVLILHGGLFHRKLGVGY